MDNHFLQNFGVKKPIVLDMVKKIMVNLYYDRNFVQFRKLRDETTKHFTDVFVKNGPTYNFINYIYHKMNTYIMSNINSEIIKYNNNNGDCEPQPFLKDNEEILFIFKGGTNMFLLKKHMDSQINEDLNEILRRRAHEEYARAHPANIGEDEFVEQKLTEYIDSFNNNFDISDSDFTLYIICKDEKRYAFLYNIVSKLLITVLEEISLEMENKLNELNVNDEIENIAQNNNGRNIPENVPFAPQILNFDNGAIADSLTIYYYEYKNIYKGLFLDILNNGITKNELVNNFINTINEKLVNNQFNDLSKLSLIKNTLTIINYVYQKGNLNAINNHLLNDLINLVNIRINHSLTANLNRINDLYKIEKFIDFKRRLVTGLNNSIVKNGAQVIFNDYQKSREELTGYRIMENIKYEDLKLKKRSSVLLKNKNILCPNVGFEIINSNEKKRHYTSVNNLIFTNISNAGHIVAFDLYRVKLNLTIQNRLITKNNKNSKKNSNLKYLIESTEPSKNIRVFNDKDFVNHPVSINIPTEFIDVSIPKFNDFNLVNERDKYYNTDDHDHIIYDHFDLITVNPVENPNIVMKSVLFYSYETLLEDLNIVLFQQNTFTCMFDSKFTKRIFRYLYFYLILLLRKAIEARTLPIPQYIDTLNDIGQNIYNITQLFEKLATYPEHNNKNLLDFFQEIYIDRHFNLINNPIMPQLISNNLINRNIGEYFEVKDQYKSIKSLINHHFVFKTLIPQKNLNNGLRNNLLEFLNIHLKYYNIEKYDNYHNRFIDDLYKLFDEEIIILKNISAYISSSLVDLNVLHGGIVIGGKSSVNSKKDERKYNSKSLKLNKSVFGFFNKNKKMKTNIFTKLNSNKSSNIIESIKKLKNIKNPCIKMNVSNISSPVIINITSLAGNDLKLRKKIRQMIIDSTKRDKDRLGIFNVIGSIDDIDEVSNGKIKK